MRETGSPEVFMASVFGCKITKKNGYTQIYRQENYVCGYRLGVIGQNCSFIERRIERIFNNIAKHPKKMKQRKKKLFSCTIQKNIVPLRVEW